MAISVGKGRANIRFDGALAETGAEIERNLRELLGPMIDECEREAKHVLRKEVYPNWPIRSTKKNPRGKSIQAWETELRLLPDRLVVEVILRNRLPYVWFIKSTKKGTRPNALRLRSPFVVHVRKPARLSVRKLAKELPELLAKQLDRVI